MNPPTNPATDHEAPLPTKQFLAFLAFFHVAYLSSLVFAYVARWHREFPTRKSLTSSTSPKAR